MEYLLFVIKWDFLLLLWLVYNNLNHYLELNICQSLGFLLSVCHISLFNLIDSSRYLIKLLLQLGYPGKSRIATTEKPAIVDCKIVETSCILENLELSISLFRVFNTRYSGIPCNSGKILTDGGVHYY